MPWREITPVSERLNMCRLAMEGGFSKSELARSFGISRKTVYKWIGRYKSQGEIGVFDRSRRPDTSPLRVSEARIREVLELKAEFPMWGPRKLQRLLEGLLGVETPSKSTVGRILSKAGLTETKEPSPKMEAIGRFERGQANELWQTDFAAPFALADGSKVWPLPVLDDHSRYCVSLIAAPDASGSSALLGFVAGAKRYGLPSELLSDHGAAFGVSRRNVSAFTAYLWALGVEHTQGRYAHPQTQGKLERFNQTLERECIQRHCYANLDDWSKRFEEYRHLYNQVRPHEALGDDVPASRYEPSCRQFLQPDKQLRGEDESVVQRRVDASGKIWLLQHHVKVGNGLAGWIVAAKHEGGGIWTISFRGRVICQAQLAKLAYHKPRP